MGKKIKERIISQDEYFARIGQGVPIGDCWIDVGNGEYAYALQEVVVVGVPFNKYGDKSFAVQHISALAIADNTRVDTRQRDVKIRVAENAIEADRTKKELVAKVKNIVNKYYDNEIKQFPEQEVLLVSQKLHFNREIITKDNFYHYDFPKKLMEGTEGKIIKELITISGGNFTDEDPRFRQTYLSQYEPSWSTISIISHRRTNDRKCCYQRNNFCHRACKSISWSYSWITLHGIYIQTSQYKISFL
jgi:hypothetical protein